MRKMGSGEAWVLVTVVLFSLFFIWFGDPILLWRYVT